MWRIIVALMLALTTAGLSASPVMAAAWTSKTPLPAARSYAAAAVINGVLYVAGGHDGTTGGTTTLQAYNPATDSWSTLAPMPGRRYQGDGAGVINGELYLAGGWNYPDSGLPQSQLFVYNPGTNLWSSKAAMPTLSGHGASGVINGKLYVTTAANGFSGWRNFLHVYDPTNNTWTSLADSPSDHVNPAFGVINNQFYVAGGDSDSGVHALLDVYDPSTNIWTSKAPMPAARQGSASAVINGKLYVIGGSNAGVYYNTVDVYDPSTDTWTTETAMPTARSGAAAGVINGVIYVAGGSNSAGTLATVEALTSATTNQLPFALFSYSPETPQVNQKVTFDASTSYDPDGTIVSYSWEFGDGGIGTGVTVEHTYATANQYSVILTVTDNNGATHAKAKTITVAQPVTPPPTTAGRRSLPDPSTFIMVGSGLALFLLYLGLSRLRWRLRRS